MPNTKFVLALDWTPNINHVGFFVAQARGYYSDTELDVLFRSPHTDGYATTPAQAVLRGDATACICPSESVISHVCEHVAAGSARLTAVASVLAKDTSAIATVEGSAISRPSDLDGKRYASYGARFEGRIVQQMIRNDGGSGQFVEDTSAGMLGIWDTLLAGKADATWIFLAWEGVMAQRKGVALRTFQLDDYEIPYGYSPVVAAKVSACEDLAPLLQKFLQASARGWQDFVQDPVVCAAEAAAAMQHLFPCLEEPVDSELMQAAAPVLAPHVLPESGAWGEMHPSRWGAFLDWLSAAGLLTTKKQSRNPSGAAGTTSLDGLRSGDVGEPIPRSDIPEDMIFTNKLLPASTCT